ncbi:smad anchor for receptor activation [Amblyomma americanum]
MDKFAVDLDKVLDELEQSEGLLSERLPEAQFPALEASGTTTQPNSKCRGDVPHQNGDHSIAPPSSVIAPTTTRLLTDPKRASSDGVTSGEAYLWDDAPSATPLHSERNAKNGMTHIPTSAAETSTAQLQDCVDFSGAPTTTHVIGHDKPTVPVSDPNQSSCLRDFAERPGYSSRQLSSAVPPDDNALAETCGVSTLPAADSHESGGGANLYCRQKDQHDDGAQLWTTCGVPEQSVPCAESRTLPAASEAILEGVCSGGASNAVLPKSSVLDESFQGPDLLSLSPVEYSNASDCPGAPKSLIILSPDSAEMQNVSSPEQLVSRNLVQDGRTIHDSSLLDSVSYLPQVEAAMPSSGVAKGTSVSDSSELPDDRSLQTVAPHLPEALKPISVSDDRSSKQENSNDVTSNAQQASKLPAVPCFERTEDQSLPADLSACSKCEQNSQGAHQSCPDALTRPTAGDGAQSSGTAHVSSCGPSVLLSDHSSGPTDSTDLQEQLVATQPVAQDCTREMDASSTSPSEGSSALPATPSVSPPPRVSPPDPALLSYSPPRSSSAPPGALPASPVRAPSTLSSASSSASAGPPSTDGLDDSVHLEGGASDHVFTDEATVITEARCLDDGERVVGFDTAAPDVTDEELNQLLREEEGGDDEGERNFLPPLSEEEQMLGKVKPFWIPDEEAPACMLCFGRFTVLKRRHHCRACGKVLCSSCCNQKAPLPCLENREGRVCLPCLTVLQRVAAVERLGGPSPANPAAYCSRGPPPLQGAPQSPPLTVLVPVLRRGPRPDGEAPKQVMFSDGIRPGGDLSDEVVPSTMPGPPRELGCRDGPAESLLQERRVVLSDIEGPLPPVALSASQRDLKLENEADLMIVLQDPNVEPVAFALTRNLHVLVKIVTVECGGARQCWNFCSRGLATLGVDEVVLLLEREPGESRIPRDALRLYATLQGIGATGAHRGAVPGGALVGGGGTATSTASVGAFQPLPFPEGVLGSSDHGGFLLLPHMGQCLDGLVLPRPPWLCAVLLQRLEMPWARLLPLRLLLRLGAEFEVYPYPMVSVRGRRSVYLEVGHTIMTVLLDFRNFQYQLASLSGLLVHLEGRQTTVRVPRNRYDALVRVLDGNEHVLALAGNLSPEADAHLVCVQAPDAGTYHSQALQALPGSAVEITGASFVVFSGALKGPGEAKHSVVEDGVLVQLSPASMGSLRTALRAMRDWHVPVVPSAPGEESGHIAVVWTEDDRPKNTGVRSPIDGRSLEGVTGVRLRAFSDFCARGLCLRWTEFFLLSCDGPTWGGCEDPQRAAEGLARAFCEALLPHLVLLQPLSPLGLRAQLGPDQVGYEAGAQGQPLPVVCQEPLDCALVPLLSGPQEPMQLEMLFHVVYQ